MAIKYRVYNDFGGYIEQAEKPTQGGYLIIEYSEENIPAWEIEINDYEKRIVYSLAEAIDSGRPYEYAPITRLKETIINP